MHLASRCLLQPLEHPLPSVLHRACPQEPQPLPFAASLDLTVLGIRSHQGCPQPSREPACLPAQFPSLSLGFGSPQPCGSKRQRAGGELQRRPVATVHASPQPRVTLEAPSSECVRGDRAGRSGRRGMGTGKGEPVPQNLGSCGQPQQPAPGAGPRSALPLGRAAPGATAGGRCASWGEQAGERLAVRGGELAAGTLQPLGALLQS